MSFDFNSNVNPINKAQATYKDGGGLGGGGMYMRQNKKRKDQSEDDMFERKEENEPNEILFESEEPEIQEENIPENTLFNKFVNFSKVFFYFVVIFNAKIFGFIAPIVRGFCSFRQIFFNIAIF